MNHAQAQARLVPAHNGDVAIRVQGEPGRQTVVMTHSILSSASMWDEQATLLADHGWYVVRIDTTGHGDSPEPSKEVITMDGLAADTVAVLDALAIPKAHYVGLSLGGMSGFGLGIHHATRLHSLVICDARADAPAAVAAPWDERIAIAEGQRSCTALAATTVERWFGKDFLVTNPVIAQRFQDIAATTSVKGFAGCARAIQGLNYLPQAAHITVPVTLIVGSNDGALPDAMQDLHQRIRGSALETVANAGHLPNVDQPAAFNAALLRHFKCFNQQEPHTTSWRPSCTRT